MPPKRPTRQAALRGAAILREQQERQRIIEQQERLSREEERARWKFDPTQWEAQPKEGVKFFRCDQQVPLGLIVEPGDSGRCYVTSLVPGSWAAEQRALEVPCELVWLNDRQASELSNTDFTNNMQARPLHLGVGSLQFKYRKRCNGGMQTNSSPQPKQARLEAGPRTEDVDRNSVDVENQHTNESVTAASEFHGDSDLAPVSFPEHPDISSQFALGVQKFWQLADWVVQKQEARVNFEEERDKHLQNLERVVGSIEELYAQFQSQFTSSGCGESSTPVPSELLHGELRPYQEEGLHWLATLYDKEMNGILADEMGLGKTIMTIALICHLALRRMNWGPHLIVVPASVQFNWVGEFMRWAPGLKILNIHGDKKQRASLRQGWTKGVSKCNVCITNYSLVLADGAAFERVHWKYLIVDEAHRIKNRASAAWLQLFRFANVRRLLLTGTPLQNDLMEVFHLLYFLMPHLFVGFAEDFKTLIVDPLQHAVRGNDLSQCKRLIVRVHDMLRPFMLRRLKKDVRISLPMKRELVVMCDLTGRQRTLYEEFMSRRDTQHRLHEGAYFRIMCIAMQLRKVCNHPELFEPRYVRTPFTMDSIELRIPAFLFLGCFAGLWSQRTLSKYSTLFPLISIYYRELSCLKAKSEVRSEPIDGTPIVLKVPRRSITKSLACLGADGLDLIGSICQWRGDDVSTLLFSRGAGRCEMCYGTAEGDALSGARAKRRLYRSEHQIWMASMVHELCETAHLTLIDDVLSQRRHFIVCCARVAVLPQSRRSLLRIEHKGKFKYTPTQTGPANRKKLAPLYTMSTRSAAQLHAALVVRLVPVMLGCGGQDETGRTCSLSHWSAWDDEWLRLHGYIGAFSSRARDAAALIGVSMSGIFPEKHLLERDSGKLQKLGKMLRVFQKRGNKCVIFSQFSSMLDILESFLTIHTFTYRRLDGMTQIADRQPLVDRFNQDPRILVFLASTRAGGVGLNLTGANVVIFFDSDWNPSVDKQAMDRVHRIGQTKEVLVYRLVTRYSLEETIWHKQLEKNYITNAILDDGQFDAHALRGLAAGSSPGVSAKDLKEILGLGAEHVMQRNGTKLKPTAKHRARPTLEGSVDDRALSAHSQPATELPMVPPLLGWAACRVYEGKNPWPKSYAPIPKSKAKKVEHSNLVTAGHDCDL